MALFQHFGGAIGIASFDQTGAQQFPAPAHPRVEINALPQGFSGFAPRPRGVQVGAKAEPSHVVGGV